jgi:Uncharacterized conserved protein
LKLYTLGFTKKSAKQFFEVLGKNNIQKLVDIRLNNVSQLAGFTKGADLKYFLGKLCNIQYVHNVSFAPTKDILDDYKKKKISWDQYEKRFNELLSQRKIDGGLIKDFSIESEVICLLCSEPTSENCHRRLVAEFIKREFPDSDIEIVHL